MLLKKQSFMVSLLILISLVLVACAPGGGVPQAVDTSMDSAGADLPGDAAGEQILNVVHEGGCGAGMLPGQDYGSPCNFGHPFYPPFLTDDTNLMPGLFTTDFEVNDDSTVYTFHIQPEAVWSDGESITAQQVVDWWHFIFAPPYANPGVRNRVMGAVQGIEEFIDGEAETISGLQVIDDKTIEVSLWRSEGSLPLLWTYREAAPARVDQYADLLERKDEFETRDEWLGAMNERFFAGENAADLIVSGPFKPVFLTPEPDAIYRFGRNPNWWGEPTLLDGIEGTTIRDFQTMLLMFESGEIDVAEFLAGPPAVLLRQNQPEVFREAPIFAYFAMYFDTEKVPTDDVNLRRALMSSIDWETMANIAWEGEQGPTNAGSPMNPAFQCYDPDFQPYPFDPDRAKEFLSQSAYAENTPKIRILTGGSDPPRIRAAQIIQEMWRVNLGVEDVEIKNAESEFVDGEGLVNIQVTSGGAPLPIPAMLLEHMAHTRSGPYNNWTHYTEDGWDEEIDALLSMNPNDPSYCDRVSAMLESYTDAALVIPTAYIKRWFQVQPWLKDYGRGNLSFWYSMSDTYIAER